MTIQKIWNNNIHRLLFSLVTILVVTTFIFIGCAGGFLDESDNADEFLNPLFHPEKLDTDTTDVIGL